MSNSEGTLLSSLSPTLITFIIFVASSSIFTNRFVKRSRRSSRMDDDDIVVDETNGPNSIILSCTRSLSYDQVLQLRKQFYSNSCSVSYSNTGPLMIVGVSLFISFII